jgi:hypothetical protein
LQGGGGVDGQHQVRGGDVVLGAVKFHKYGVSNVKGGGFARDYPEPALDSSAQNGTKSLFLRRILTGLCAQK